MGEFKEEIIIEKPCVADKKIIGIIKNNSLKYDCFLKKKGFIYDIVRGVKLRLMYKKKYIEIKNFIDSFDYNKNKISELLDKFNEVSSYIALNNILLTYAYVTEKKDKFNLSIITKEDEKLENLKKLYEKKISIKEFKKKFGHYGFNNFSLGCEKFWEYHDGKLIKLGKLNENWKLVNKINYVDYIKKHENFKYQIYKYLREELKYIALKIICEIRLKIKEIEKKEKEVFNLELDYIIKKYDEI